MLEAKEINDLFKTSPIEDKLYKEIKRQKIPVERQLYVCEGDRKYFLDIGIFCREGKIDVECNGKKFHSGQEAHDSDRKRNNELTSLGWSILRFTGSEINRDTKACIKKIRRTVKSLGGIL